MTTENLPDVIWAYNDGCTVEITCPPTEHDIFPHAEYLLAEPVKELLKQARDALLNAHITVKHYGGPDLIYTDRAITAIDKFLGDDK